MRPLLIILMMIVLTTVWSQKAKSQGLDFAKIKSFEHQLEDVMEVIDTDELKTKLKDVKESYDLNPNEISKARLGIIYHETALNLSFFSKSEYRGYARMSYDLLSHLINTPETTSELLPFIESYRASALSLVSAETRNLKSLGESFALFENAVKTHASVSYLPEFLRGSVAENLPWFLFSKRKFAKKDFQSIIEKQNINNEYANWRIMSFAYLAWARQRQNSKYKNQALSYLNKAISLDPDYKAGRQKAEKLKSKMSK